jgi:multidrug efflux pump subunit AcrA (membrane-fusion protein)
MEEAVDQAACIVRPVRAGQEAAVTRAHDELSVQQGSGVVCTVPLAGESGYIGAITLERAADRPFDEETLAASQALVGVIGPILDMKLREARPLVFKGMESLRRLLAALLGPAHLRLKTTCLAIALFAVLAAMVDGTHKVTAPATIEGAVRQLLVAPQDGFVKQAEVRAGDLVEKGQLIASLDERALRLELQKWEGERNKVEKEYQEALAKRDRIGLGLLQAEIEKLQAEMRLVADKLARTRLEAPFEGVIVSGDLSQSLGAPVETGQVLFEVAPLDSYRVVIEVDEYDVADMETGKTGQLVMAALPRTPYAVSVHRVVPVAVSGEGRNFFRVEATLDQPSQLLRPGMRGVAKIEIGPRKLLWIWTHDLVERLRLWAWSVGL